MRSIQVSIPSVPSYSTALMAPFQGVGRCLHALKVNLCVLDHALDHLLHAHHRHIEGCFRCMIELLIAQLTDERDCASGVTTQRNECFLLRDVSPFLCLLGIAEVNILPGIPRR